MSQTETLGVPEDDSEEEARWVQRRTQYLSSAGVGFREKVAEAVAWSDLGYSPSGVSNKLDVGESTAKGYFDTATSVYPGIVAQSYVDIDGDAEHPVEEVTASAPNRECPVCLKERLCSPENAREAFSVSTWGATAMLDGADAVCAFCYSVRVDGTWKRMKQPGSRAMELAQGSSKSKSDYRDVLTSGISTGDTAGSSSGGRAADDADDLEW